MRADLFVYGTLRRSERAHKLLGVNASFLREAWTLPVYTLYQFGWYPGLVKDGNTAVKGEVWSIMSAEWPRLDAYEGVPDEYVRTLITLNDGTQAYAYIFIGSLENAVLLEGGDWMVR